MKLCSTVSIERPVTPVDVPVESRDLKGPSARSQEDAGSKAGVAVKREIAEQIAPFHRYHNLPKRPV